MKGDWKAPILPSEFRHFNKMVGSKHSYNSEGVEPAASTRWLNLKTWLEKQNFFCKGKGIGRDGVSFSNRSASMLFRRQGGRGGTTPSRGGMTSLFIVDVMMPLVWYIAKSHVAPLMVIIWLLNQCLFISAWILPTTPAATNFSKF